jgi:predicted nucleic acid-binding protein
MRVFLDANILFSAAKTDGAVRQLFNLLVDGRHECWVDEYVVIEARRNLAAKNPDALAVLEALLRQTRISLAQAPGAGLKSVSWLPEKDRPVLAAAMRLHCEVLVTGDRMHFGAAYGKVVGGVAIHSPRSLAGLLFGRH